MLPEQHCGIYSITNAINGHQYIGSSLYFPTRWSHHRKALRRGDHHAIPLQHAWNKYGEAAFTFAPVELCSPDVLKEREQYWLDTLTPAYNLARYVDRPRQGRTWTAEERERIAAKVRGWIPTPEQLARRRKSAEERQRGVPMSEEVRARISAARRGRPMAEETKAKLSAYRKNRKFGPHSAEHRQHIADALRGKPKSPEQIEQMRARQQGKRLSESTRAAMSIAQKARYARQRLARENGQDAQIHRSNGATVTPLDADAQRTTTDVSGAHPSG